jgi:hypothetical protein
MSDNTHIKCGFCNGAIAKTRSSTVSTYIKRCVCCNKEYKIKDSCAHDMFKKSGNQKDSERITSRDFNNSSIQLYCINCKQNCFYCKKPHSGKLQI